MSDTPRTDAVTQRIMTYFDGTHEVEKSKYGALVSADFARTLERENNQLRADLKQCAEAIEVIFSNDGVEDKDRNGDIIGYSFQNHSELCRMLKRALSLPSVQAVLKEKA